MIFTNCLRKVIVINKIVTRVIRGVNINHLDFAKISLTDNFQYIKVVALNVEILRVVEVHTFLTAGTERLCGRRICQVCVRSLVRPCELVAFLALVNHVGGQLIAQLLEVYLKDSLLAPPPINVCLHSVTHCGNSFAILSMFEPATSRLCIFILSIL